MEIEPLKLRQYLDKTNDVMRVLQEPKPMRISDYTVVVGLVLKRAVDSYAQDEKEKETVVNAMCESLRVLCLDKKK